MKLSEFKQTISSIEELNFQLENKEPIPKHFHITEIGTVLKTFIDCGGTIREEKVINFQLWHKDDFNHRLSTQKVADIISIAEKELFLEDIDIEVEYQKSTIGKYGLEFNGNSFILKSKNTACLAEDRCEIPSKKEKLELNKSQNHCSPGSSCC